MNERAAGHRIDAVGLRPRVVQKMQALVSQRAFLSKGQDIFIVRVGDSVEGRIMVTANDASSARLRETGTSLETTLSLTKDSGSAF